MVSLSDSNVCLDYSYGIISVSGENNGFHTLIRSNMEIIYRERNICWDYWNFMENQIFQDL